MAVEEVVVVVRSILLNILQLRASQAGYRGGWNGSSVNLGEHPYFSIVITMLLSIPGNGRSRDLALVCCMTDRMMKR